MDRCVNGGSNTSSRKAFDMFMDKEVKVMKVKYPFLTLAQVRLKAKELWDIQKLQSKRKSDPNKSLKLKRKSLEEARRPVFRAKYRPSLNIQIRKVGFLHTASDGNSSSNVSSISSLKYNWNSELKEKSAKENCKPRNTVKKTAKMKHPEVKKADRVSLPRHPVGILKVKSGARSNKSVSFSEDSFTCYKPNFPLSPLIPIEKPDRFKHTYTRKTTTRYYGPKAINTFLQTKENCTWSYKSFQGKSSMFEDSYYSEGTSESAPLPKQLTEDVLGSKIENRHQNYPPSKIGKEKTFGSSNVPCEDSMFDDRFNQKYPPPKTKKDKTGKTLNLPNGNGLFEEILYQNYYSPKTGKNKIDRNMNLSNEDTFDTSLEESYYQSYPPKTGKAKINRNLTISHEDSLHQNYLPKTGKDNSNRHLDLPATTGRDNSSRNLNLPYRYVLSEVSSPRFSLNETISEMAEVILEHEDIRIDPLCTSLKESFRNDDDSINYNPLGDDLEVSKVSICASESAEKLASLEVDQEAVCTNKVYDKLQTTVNEKDLDTERDNVIPPSLPQEIHNGILQSKDKDVSESRQALLRPHGAKMSSTARPCRLYFGTLNGQILQRKISSLECKEKVARWLNIEDVSICSPSDQNKVVSPLNSTCRGYHASTTIGIPLGNKSSIYMRYSSDSESKDSAGKENVNLKKTLANSQQMQLSKTLDETTAQETIPETENENSSIQISEPANKEQYCPNIEKEKEQEVFSKQLHEKETDSRRINNKLAGTSKMNSIKIGLSKHQSVFPNEQKLIPTTIIINSENTDAGNTHSKLSKNCKISTDNLDNETSFQTQPKQNFLYGKLDTSIDMQEAQLDLEVDDLPVKTQSSHSKKISKAPKDKFKKSILTNGCNSKVTNNRKANKKGSACKKSEKNVAGNNIESSSDEFEGKKNYREVSRKQMDESKTCLTNSTKSKNNNEKSLKYAKPQEIFNHKDVTLPNQSSTQTVSERNKENDKTVYGIDNDDLMKSNQSAERTDKKQSNKVCKNKTNNLTPSYNTNNDYQSKANKPIKDIREPFKLYTNNEIQSKINKSIGAIKESFLINKIPDNIARLYKSKDETAPNKLSKNSNKPNNEEVLSLAEKGLTHSNTKKMVAKSFQPNEDSRRVLKSKNNLETTCTTKENGRFDNLPRSKDYKRIDGSGDSWKDVQKYYGYSTMVVKSNFNDYESPRIPSTPFNKSPTTTQLLDIKSNYSEEAGYPEHSEMYKDIEFDFINTGSNSNTNINHYTPIDTIFEFTTTSPEYSLKSPKCYENEDNEVGGVDDIIAKMRKIGECLLEPVKFQKVASLDGSDDFTVDLFEDQDKWAAVVVKDKNKTKKTNLDTCSEWEYESLSWNDKYSFPSIDTQQKYVDYHHASEEVTQETVDDFPNADSEERTVTSCSNYHQNLRKTDNFMLNFYDDQTRSIKDSGLKVQKVQRDVLNEMKENQVMKRNLEMDYEEPIFKSKIQKSDKAVSKNLFQTVPSYKEQDKLEANVLKKKCGNNFSGQPYGRNSKSNHVSNFENEHNCNSGSKNVQGNLFQDNIAYYSDDNSYCSSNYESRNNNKDMYDFPSTDFSEENDPPYVPAIYKKDYKHKTKTTNYSKHPIRKKSKTFHDTDALKTSTKENSKSTRKMEKPVEVVYPFKPSKIPKLMLNRPQMDTNRNMNRVGQIQTHSVHKDISNMIKDQKIAKRNNSNYITPITKKLSVQKLLQKPVRRNRDFYHGNNEIYDCSPVTYKQTSARLPHTQTSARRSLFLHQKEDTPNWENSFLRSPESDSLDKTAEEDNFLFSSCEDLFRVKVPSKPKKAKKNLGVGALCDLF